MPRGEADSLAAAWTDAVEAWAALLGCTVHSPSFEADEQHYLGPVELSVAEVAALPEGGFWQATRAHQHPRHTCHHQAFPWLSQVPRVKFVVRAAIDISYLLLFAHVLLWCPPDLWCSPAESVFYSWTATNALEEYLQYLSAGSLKEHLRGFWNVVDALKYALLLFAVAAHAIALALWLFPLVPQTMLYATLANGRISLSLGALVACLRSLFAMLAYQQSFGVLFISCFRIMADIKRFMVMLTIVMLAFAIAFSGLLSVENLVVPNSAEPDGTPDEANAIEPRAAQEARGPPWAISFWAIFGESLGHETQSQPRVVAVLLWVYFMLSQCVLINLLTALMSETWERVNEAADDEWKFLYVSNIDEFFGLPPVPPPFNAWLILRHLYLRDRGADPEMLAGRRAESISMAEAELRKRSKMAQRDLVRNEAASEGRTVQAQLSELAMRLRRIECHARAG